MLSFILITGSPDSFKELKSGWLKQSRVQVRETATVQGALDLMADKAADLVIVDENVENQPGRMWVEQLIKKNPMINTALVSSLSAEDFHEATEGLGILMQIPPEADGAVADDVVSRMDKLLSFYR